jgi:hypothetical protein
MEENKLVVKNMDGNDITINVIDILENTETNKQFICYTIEGLSETDAFISTLEEKEDSYSLGEVTEEEKNEIEELMNQKDGE